MKITYHIHKVFVRDYGAVKDFIHRVVWFGTAEENGDSVTFAGATDFEYTLGQAVLNFRDINANLVKTWIDIPATGARQDASLRPIITKEVVREQLDEKIANRANELREKELME